MQNAMARVPQMDMGMEAAADLGCVFGADD
jgi:hypothetical protein